MKKYLILFLLACFSWPVQAEEVSSVSFNPSRLGEYTYLKAASKAVLLGGLKTPKLNLAVAGTSTISMNLNNTTDGLYLIDTLTGRAGSSLYMPNTIFHGIGDTNKNYNAEDSSAPGGYLAQVTASGGTQLYMQDSYINTIYAREKLKQKVNTLTMTNAALSITGDEGLSVNLYTSGTSTLGFRLAGNDIPVPLVSHTNTGKKLTNCSLVWEKRQTSTSPSQEVWLLALQGCTAN